MLWLWPHRFKPTLSLKLQLSWWQSNSPPPPKPSPIPSIPLLPCVFDRIDRVIKPIWHEQWPSMIKVKLWPNAYAETYGPPWWRGRLMALAGRWEQWAVGGAGGCQQAWTRVSLRQALLGPHQLNAGCQATHWNGGGFPVCLLPLSTNFLAGWSRSNLSGPAHTDALCHSIKQNVLLVSRHVKEVTGKVNLTLNAPVAIIPPQMC